MPADLTEARAELLAALEATTRADLEDAYKHALNGAAILLLMHRVGVWTNIGKIIKAQPAPDRPGPWLWGEGKEMPRQVTVELSKTEELFCKELGMCDSKEAHGNVWGPWRGEWVPLQAP